VEGLPEPKNEDVSGLKKKVEELLAEKKAAEAKRKESEAAARKAAEEAARKSGDVESLEKSWREKLETAQSESKAEIDRLNGSLKTIMVDNVATTIANEIALQGSANVLLPHIRSRLAVDYVDGNPITRVLGPDGKPSAATLDELKAEFAANDAFAPIIAGSKASGGGAGGSNSGRAASKGLKRSEMTSVQKREYIEAHGQAEYLKLPQ
jgi:hypothetical protein